MLPKTRRKNVATNRVRWKVLTEAQGFHEGVKGYTTITFKYHVFAPMGRFQLELIYLYFPPSFHLTLVVSVL